jgi:hypothetical protein
MWYMYMYVYEIVSTRKFPDLYFTVLFLLFTV